MQVQRVNEQAFQETGQIKKIGEPEEVKEWAKLISFNYFSDTLQGWEPYNRLARIHFTGDVPTFYLVQVADYKRLEFLGWRDSSPTEKEIMMEYCENCQEDKIAIVRCPDCSETICPDCFEDYCACGHRYSNESILFISAAPWFLRRRKS